MNPRHELRFPLTTACAIALIAACLARSATAGLPVPDAAQSQIGIGMALVGTTGGVADPVGEKTIVIRDQLGNPIPNSTVAIHFGSCQGPGGIRICDPQPFPGVSVSCADEAVAALTNVNGIATFRVAGFATNPGGGTFGAPAPGSSGFCATVTADGFLMGTLAVAAYDQNGTGGVDTPDLALFLNDLFSMFGTTLNRTRSDYDFNGKVDVRDLGMWLRVRFAGNSSVGCPTACP